MKTAFTNTWKPTLILLVLILAGCGLRWACISWKTTPSHDECISYLAACGNQGLYALQPPTCQWHSVADIHHFFEMNPETSWGQIRDDLARYDIHPPLYFWLLHFWAKIWGISPHTGPALNLVFVCLSALGLFFLGQRVFWSTWCSILAVFVWLFSPMVASISLDTRQYELLGTVSIYYLLVLVDFCRSDRGYPIWKLILLSLLTAAGLLTHYYFAILVSGAGVYMLTLSFWEHRQKECKETARTSGQLIRILLFLGITLAGLFLFILVNPEFLNSFSNQRNQAVPFSIGGLVSRLGKTVRCGIGFFVYPREWILVFLGVLCLALIPSGFYWKRLAQFFLLNPSLMKPGGGQFLTVLSAWYGGWTVLLYVGFLTPGMGGRYLAPFWPVFSLGLVTCLYRVGIQKTFGIVPLVIFHLIAGGAGLVYGYRQDPERQPLPPLQGEWVLVDSVQRGTLPRVTWNLDKNMALLACSQDEILSRIETWSVDPPNGSGLFASVKMYNSLGKSTQILETLKRDFSVELVVQNWLDLVDFYRIEPEMNPGRQR